MNERIAELIRALGLRQMEFAKRLSLSQPFVSALCSGSKTPSERTVYDICREFNVNEHWLRTGEGEMFRPQTTEQELYALLGDLMADKPDFRHRLITVLLRMSPEEWHMLERKMEELAEDMHRGAP